MLTFSTEKKLLRRHFERDPALFAYHLGDLDDFMFQDCIWGVSCSRSTAIDEVALVFTGGKIPTVLAFGVSESFDPLLSDLCRVLPDRFHCHFQEQFRHVFDEFFNSTDIGTHLKMKLTKYSSAHSQERGIEVVSLDQSHESELLSLYTQAYPEHYFVPRMLDTGKYLGCRINGELVAVAGVHVDSSEYNVAVLGNIAAHPEYRGRGLATELTSRLTKELDSEGKLVCLNVEKSNTAARKCYEKTGFKEVHEYQEALFRREGKAHNS